MTDLEYEFISMFVWMSPYLIGVSTFMALASIYIGVDRLRNYNSAITHVVSHDYPRLFHIWEGGESGGGGALSTRRVSLRLSFIDGSGREHVVKKKRSIPAGMAPQNTYTIWYNQNDSMDIRWKGGSNWFFLCSTVGLSCRWALDPNKWICRRDEERDVDPAKFIESGTLTFSCGEARKFERPKLRLRGFRKVDADIDS